MKIKKIAVTLFLSAVLVSSLCLVGASAASNQTKTYSISDMSNGSTRKSTSSTLTVGSGSFIGSGTFYKGGFLAKDSVTSKVDSSINTSSQYTLARWHGSNGDTTTREGVLTAIAEGPYGRATLKAEHVVTCKQGSASGTFKTTGS